MHLSTTTTVYEHAPPSTDSIFQSFWMGGFECATHRRHDGRRLDCIASTRHDELVWQDYERLHSVGMETARDGVRWHLCEPTIGQYDWSSIYNQVRAASDTNTQVIWDLFHYGWPDDLNIFSPRFVDSFANFARAFARFLREESDQTPFFAPVNEISFFSWGGGDAGFFNPYSHARGFELKRQLVRASICAIEAIWEVFPGARIIHPDPIINVLPSDNEPESIEMARHYHQLQFQSWDMIGGLLCPELGGHMKYLDILGANYYAYNQWLHPGGPGATLSPTDKRYRPLSELLAEAANRYNRPIFLSETGIEAGARPMWLRYIGRELRTALNRGVPLHGVCWYPILNHPGWDDDRHCHNGLWDYPNEWGDRELNEPLARELEMQMRLMNEEDPEEPEVDLYYLDRATLGQGEEAIRSREENSD